MKPKIIALDIDGTLFDSSGIISERTLEAVKDCTDRGIIVVFATGRDYDALPLDQIEGCGIKYAVTTNGSAIYDLELRRCVWESPMEQQDILDILSYTDDRDVFTYLFLDGHGYAETKKLSVFERVNWPKHMKDATRKNIHPVKNLAEYIMTSENAVQKGAILFPAHANCNPAGWEEIKKYLNDLPGVHAVDGGCENIEFNRFDITKASGLEQFAGYMGVSMADTIAIGDSENDIDILEAAGIGIAMGNASEEIKKRADYVTLSNDDAGVAVVLEKILQE